MGLAAGVGVPCRLTAPSTTWSVGPGAPPTQVRHPVRMNSREHHFGGEHSDLSRPTSSSPTSWQLSRAHLFCPFIKELNTPTAYSCGEGRGARSGHFSAMPWLPFWRLSVVLTGTRGKYCCWKHWWSFFQRLFSRNVVILYGNELWLTFSEDISLKTLRVFICSKEAFTLFEAQSQWENRFSGAYYV